MADEDLVARVAALEAAVADLVARRSTSAPSDAGGDATLWVLDGLRRRFPDGAVVFAGDVPMASGDRYEWQWGRKVDDVVASDWSTAVAAIDALAHPVRLRLLQRILTGPGTTADLSDDEALGTTGQLYHHLRQLVSAGWLKSSGRGRYAVPGDRVVPLLVILMGAQR
jgi:hypothetical protein